MDRPLDDLIKEKHQQHKNNQKNKNFKGKISKTEGKRQERKEEPYNKQKPTLQQSHINKRDNLTFTVNNKQAKNSNPENLTFSVNNRNQKKTAVPVSQDNHSPKLSIFERIGNVSNSTKDSINSGTAVTISNINNDVTLADLSELCGAVGEILGASFELTAPKSKKIANVRFARRSDAISFVQKFHNLPLDGIPLNVCLTGDHGKENPFNPISATSSSLETKGPTREPKNIRSGLFGTKMNSTNDEDDEEEEEEEYEEDEEEEEEDDDDGNNGQQRFTVTMKGSNFRPPSAPSGGGNRRNFHQQQHQHQQGGRNVRNSGGDGRGGNQGGGRGGNQGGGSSNRGGGRGGGSKGDRGDHKKDRKPNVSSNDLDNDLDTYFASR